MRLGCLIPIEQPQCARRIKVCVHVVLIAEKLIAPTEIFLSQSTEGSIFERPLPLAEWLQQ